MLELIGQLEQHAFLREPVRHFLLDSFDENDPKRRPLLPSPLILLHSRERSRTSLSLGNRRSSDDLRARFMAGGRISFNDAPGQNGIDVGEQLGIAEPELVLSDQVHEDEHLDLQLVAFPGIQGLVDRFGQ